MARQELKGDRRARDGPDVHASLSDGEADYRTLAVCGPHALAMALANAPDNRTRLAAVHDLGIVLPVPRT